MYYKYIDGNELKFTRWFAALNKWLASWVALSEHVVVIVTLGLYTPSWFVAFSSWWHRRVIFGTTTDGDDAADVIEVCKEE